MLRNSSRTHISLAISVFLIAALAAPAMALARGGNGKADKGASGRKQVASQAPTASSDSGTGTEAKAGPSGAKDAATAEKAAAKAARKAAKAAARAERKAAKATGLESSVSAEGATGSPDGSLEPTPAVETSGSTDASPPVEAEEGDGPGIENALASITRNLEKSLAKIADGKKKQLPPGLVRVWQKFASWLGIDPTTQPGYEAPPVDPATVEPTSTVEPTATVEPTPTVEPSSTVEPTETVDPTMTVEPTATIDPGDVPPSDVPPAL